MKRVIGASITFAIVVAALASAQQRTPPPPALRIIVVEGEDAVNVLQQKTAIAPLVEVRDRNNLPVAGATVQFVIQQAGGGATVSFANAQTAATVTTNAAGRAAAPQLQALRGGAVRINVNAAFQNAKATTTITQTNFATLADAKAAGRNPTNPTSGGSASAAAGTTPGMAATAAGLGAAGVSAAVAATQAARSGCDSSSNSFTADLAAAIDACSPRGPSCGSTAQQAADSLGEWCSCDGRDAVAASLAATGSSFDALGQGAVFAGISFPPNSCR